MRIFDYQDVKAEEVEEGSKNVKVRWLITKDLGAKNFAMRWFEMAPNGFTPLHEHPWEHEVFVLKGKGIVKGSSGESEFKEGDVIFIPPNETHQFTNNSEENIEFLCLIPYME